MKKDQQRNRRGRSVRPSRGGIALRSCSLSVRLSVCRRRRGDGRGGRRLGARRRRVAFAAPPEPAAGGRAGGHVVGQLRGGGFLRSLVRVLAPGGRGGNKEEQHEE